MKTKIIFLTFIVVFLYNSPVFAQSERPPQKVVKQQPRSNETVKANSPAPAKTKIHANSNSVYGTKKTHPNYEKKDPPKKDAIKPKEELKKSFEKKDKK